jgi:hypothetical protein
MTSDGFSLTGRSRHHHDEDVPVKVAYDSYLQFDRSLDDQLIKLVIRWAHTAAPNAQRTLMGRERGANHLP